MKFNAETIIDYELLVNSKCSIKEQGVPVSKAALALAEVTKASGVELLVTFHSDEELLHAHLNPDGVQSVEEISDRIVRRLEINRSLSQGKTPFPFPLSGS